jgi:predicted Rossmann fold nucleotide-binding protein DprA/Smf involved in DNA uptake
MTTSAQTEATLLLTVRFGKPQKSEPRPLSAAELQRLVDWLKGQGRGLSDLVTEPDTSEILRGFADVTVASARVAGLLARAGALGLQMERWQRAGLWVMTWFDPDYPSRLTTRLHAAAPPVLFGCGHRPLLDRGGLAVVGSRNASESDLEYTKGLARGVARDGITVVSGGARGVDETAMLSALEVDGTAVGVLAESLVRAATSVKYRTALMKRNLALVSPYNPDAAFDAGNAMGRNRLIYCAADAAVVIASTRQNGGTWAGAIEALKHRWVPVWVRRSETRGSGNSGLVDSGAQWLPDDLEHPAALVPRAEGIPLGVAERSNGCGTPDAPSLDPHSPPDGSGEMTLYEVFLSKVAAAARSQPIDADELREKLDLTRTQVSAWLKRAVAEKRLQKTSKPVRYRSIAQEQGELPL